MYKKLLTLACLSLLATNTALASGTSDTTVTLVTFTNATKNTIFFLDDSSGRDSDDNGSNVCTTPIANRSGGYPPNPDSHSFMLAPNQSVTVNYTSCWGGNESVTTKFSTCSSSSPSSCIFSMQYTYTLDKDEGQTHTCDWSDNGAKNNAPYQIAAGDCTHVDPTTGKTSDYFVTLKITDK